MQFWSLPNDQNFPLVAYFLQETQVFNFTYVKIQVLPFNQSWHMDIGDNHHLTSIVYVLISLMPYRSLKKMILRNDSTLYRAHYGKWLLSTQTKSLKLHTMLQVIMLAKNLISIKELYASNNVIVDSHHILFVPKI